MLWGFVSANKFMRLLTLNLSTPKKNSITIRMFLWAQFFALLLLQENAREIRVLQTNHRTFRIASSDALPTELRRRQVMIWAFLWIFCWGWWFSVFYPSPSFRKWFVESPHKANTINKNRQFTMGARKRKFWVSIEFQMKSEYKSGLRCKLWTILYCKLQFSTLLAYFQNSPQLNHWIVTKGNLHFSTQCFYVLGAIN